MAAMRSALAMLGRRGCGSSGSSTAASMGGRGLEIRQVLSPAARRTPSLHPAAVRNLQSLQRFSSGWEPADKAESVLRTWWRRCANRVKNADVLERARLSLAYSVVVVGGSACYVLKAFKDVNRRP